MNNTFTLEQLHESLKDFQRKQLGKSNHFIPYCQPCLDEDMPTIHGVKLDCHMMWLIQQNNQDFLDSIYSTSPKTLSKNFEFTEFFKGI